MKTGRGVSKRISQWTESFVSIARHSSGFSAFSLFNSPKMKNEKQSGEQKNEKCKTEHNGTSLATQFVEISAEACANLRSKRVLLLKLFKSCTGMYSDVCSWRPITSLIEREQHAFSWAF